MSARLRLAAGLVVGGGLTLALAAVGQAGPAAPARPVQATPTPYDVLIVPAGLRPPILAVPEGAAVRWTNETDVVHSTTHVPDVGQPVEWASGDIQPLAQFTHTFKTAGIYNYLDARYADDVTFQGAVVVKRYEPTATPLTPTVGPTPTTGPTSTPPPPSATLPPTPTRPPPTRVPVALVGWLERADDPVCGIDALLRPCGGVGAPVPVRSDGALDPALFGREVMLEGVMTHCPARGIDYLWHLASAALPGACGSPTPSATPAPTATPGPIENLALGRPVTAKGPVVPGFEPEQAVDGRAGTVWYSPHTVSWLYVDLGQARTFNQVRLNWAYPYAERYGIYVWEEGGWRGKLVVDNARGGEDVRTLPFVEARFVMLYLITSNVQAGGFQLAEWEIYGEERPNWARGQPVVVSGEMESHPGSAATDGLPWTDWLSRAGEPNPWLGIYLPSAVEMVEFRLNWSGAYPRAYTLVFFEQGRQTAYFSTIRVDRPGLHRLVGRVPMRADTIMVYVYEVAPEGYVGLFELEIYGPGPRPGDDALPVDAWLVPRPASATLLRLPEGVTR